MADDDEVGLPQKGLNSIIKDVIPDTRVANETRDMLNLCCIEFIKYVSREAQRICAQEQRKTICHEHVQKALKNLGFDHDYVQACDAVLGECRVTAEKKMMRKNSRLDRCGIPEEELLRLQQQLIDKARQEEAEKLAAHASQEEFGDADRNSLIALALATNSATNHDDGSHEKEEEDYDVE